MKHPTTHSRDYVRTVFSKQRLLFLICLFLILFSQNSNAQSTPGIAISWNGEVGCQTYSDTLGPKPRDIIFLENITDGDSIRVCEFSSVTYTLTNEGPSPNTQWTASGGTISNATTNSCQVNWGTAGAGAVTFTVNTPSGLVTHTLSIIIIQSPTALFTIAPSNIENQTINTCANQTLNFTNLTSLNGGTALVSYYWDFGDGTTSTVENPSHLYVQTGTYNVNLTVTNACNCSSTYSAILIAEQRGFDIVCPGVVCDGQTADYSLPFDGIQLCDNNFNWTVQGGTITAQADGNLTVIWDQVDTTGFGYVTFDPSGCDLDCPLPTTIKVPVIQTAGTIIGKTDICANEFERYTLPEWPATEFTWEIVGNADGSLAEVIPADHRNEVVIRALQQGTLTLRATYYNTLLHCGGTAEFTIVVGSTVAFSGPDIVCKGMAATYTTDDGTPVNWSFRNISTGTTTTEYNISTFTTPPLITVGSYIITVWGIGICPGQSKTVAAIAVPEQPAYNSVFGDEIICPDAPYVYYIANPDPNSQYTWSATNGSVIGSDIGNEVTVKFTGAGPFAIKVFRETLAPISCRSKTTTKTIQLQQINAQIVTSHGLNICGSNYGDYQANFSSTTDLYNEGETYVWSLEDPSLGSIIANPDAPIGTTGQGKNKIRVLWNNVLTPTEKLLKLEIKKCTIDSLISIPITVLPIPTISINSVNSICSESEITFSIDSNIILAPTTVVTWNFGNGTTIAGAAGETSITTTFHNTSIGNNGYLVTATITQPNGCYATVTATKEVTVNPGPNASITMEGGNAFCDQSQIATLLIASTAAGASIHWYLAPNIDLGQTGGTLQLDENYPFGEYYFTSTASNGCTTTSAKIRIMQKDCGLPNPCSTSIIPTLTNQADIMCDYVQLSGTASPTPLAEFWEIVGPGIAESFIDNPLDLNMISAGEYHTYFAANYLDDCGQTYTVREYNKVTIPYIPKFNYQVTCSGTGSYTITLTDNSDFFNPVLNRTFKYYISTNGGVYTLLNAGSITNPVYTGPIAPGNHVIKLEIDGTLDNAPQETCLITLPVTIAPIVAPQVTYNTPLCHDTPVKFTITNPQDGDTYLWTFNNGSTNYQSSPEIVFTNSGLQNVSLEITNKYGCKNSYPLLPQPNRPVKCFNGDIISTPEDATVCKGSSVTLQYYSPTLGECPITQYILMNGLNPVENPVFNTTTHEFSVYTPGFYWMKVKNNNGCVYECPTRITPAFRTPPSVKIVGPANICLGETAVLTATTNASTYSWTIDGSIPQNYDNPELNLANLSVGNHTIILTGQDSSTPSPCSASATHIINVAEAPAVPSISFQLLNNDCDAYLIQLTATASGSGTFHWSNGATGSTTIVTDGGPYQVKFTNAGGCSTTAQVNVPKNPEDFFWIFPSGCFTVCRENFGSVIGPNLLVPYWAWLYNQNAVSTGTNSFMDPYALNDSGTYNMQLNTGLCNKTSLPLNYTQLNNCEECAVSQVITESITTQSLSYCAFDVSLTILTSDTVGLVTITAPGDEVIISPASFVVGASGTSYSFTVIPINGFPGGVVTLHINGTLPDGSPCLSIFQITLPNCQGGGQSKMVSDEKAATANTSLALYPNPARNEVSIQFDGDWENAQLEVYDLTGRLVANYTTQQAQGTWQLPLHNMAAGVYVVVLKANNQILMQKKLQVL